MHPQTEKKTMNKKSQVGMMETIAVIIVFIIMMMIGFVYYVQFQTKSMEKQEQKRNELLITEMLTAIQTLPELQCSAQMCAQCGGSDLSFSYDLDKARIGNQIIKEQLKDYISILKSSQIILEIYDPRFIEDDENKRSILVYNMSLPYETKAQGFFIPATIFDARTQTCYFGALNITIYS